MKTLLCLCALLLCASASLAQQVTTGASSAVVSVPSASVGTLLCGPIRVGCRFFVPTTAAVPVCFVFVNQGTSCTTFTNPAQGVCVSQGNGFEINSYEDHWNGLVCGLLGSGSTAVSVGTNQW